MRIVGAEFNEGAKPLLLHWHWRLGRWAVGRAPSDEQVGGMGREVGMTALRGDHNMSQDGACGRQRARVSPIQRPSSRNQPVAHLPPSHACLVRYGCVHLRWFVSPSGLLS